MKIFLKDFRTIFIFDNIKYGKNSEESHNNNSEIKSENMKYGKNSEESHNNNSEIKFENIKYGKNLEELLNIYL